MKVVYSFGRFGFAAALGAFFLVIGSPIAGYHYKEGGKKLMADFSLTADLGKRASIF